MRNLEMQQLSIVSGFQCTVATVRRGVFWNINHHKRHVADLA